MEKTTDFIGIGAPRSASTWLSQCLYEHPSIIFPNKKSGEKLHPLDKEQNFFSQALFRRSYSQKNRYSKGINWYINRFQWDKQAKIRGEFSVGYFADQKAPARIKKHFPHVKLLVTLRNPVQMVYSAYYHLKALVHTQVPKNFDQAVAENKINELRLGWGKYYDHLKKYYSLFPDKNINITLVDDIENNPYKTVKKVYTFLNVDAEFTPPSINIKRHSAVKTKSNLLKQLGFKFLKALEELKLKNLHNHVGRNRNLYLLYQKINLTPWKYPPMKKKTRKKLLSYYQKDIQKLEKLIKRDLSSWLK